MKVDGLNWSATTLAMAYQFVHGNGNASAFHEWITALHDCGLVLINDVFDLKGEDLLCPVYGPEKRTQYEAIVDQYSVVEALRMAEPSFKRWAIIPIDADERCVGVLTEKTMNNPWQWALFLATEGDAVRARLLIP